MSKYDDQIAFGNTQLFEQLADDRAYWPGGDSGAAVTIPVVFTGHITEDLSEERGTKTQLAIAEAMVLQSDVASPVIKSDIVVIDSDNWRVMRVLESVGGIHRLEIQKMARSVAGGGMRRG